MRLIKIKITTKIITSKYVLGNRFSPIEYAKLVNHWLKLRRPIYIIKRHKLMHTHSVYILCQLHAYNKNQNNKT